MIALGFCASQHFSLRCERRVAPSTARSTANDASLPSAHHVDDMESNAILLFVNDHIEVASSEVEPSPVLLDVTRRIFSRSRTFVVVDLKVNDSLSLVYSLRLRFSRNDP